jgi:Cdc6-like AAA superfamily ATPase
MSLRDKLQIDARPASDPRKMLFEHFGVIDNPFPPAAQPTGHPRLDDNASDGKVISAIREFVRDHTTQVLVIEGTQGIGKTNLLNYYQRELQDLYREDETFYVIRYYPDPEPTFDAIVRRVFQELGSSHLVLIGNALDDLAQEEAEEVLELARGHEVRIMLGKLQAAVGDDDTLELVAETAMEWLVGLRLLNKHRDTLGVQFRLDTVESKTQALRDIVFVSERLKLLKGIFLLLDELEKQDYSLSKTPVLRYLSAIRALIDALPKRLFLMLAITSEARRRYFEMLPAIASRLENRITLLPLRHKTEAVKLARFYEQKAKERAQQSVETQSWRAGNQTLLTSDQINEIFEKAVKASADRGIEGVIHRDLLNRLRVEAEVRLNGVR